MADRDGTPRRTRPRRARRVRGTPELGAAGRRRARARLIVIDRLLDSYAMWNEAQRSVTFLPRQVFPPGAQVVAVTGLHDERMTEGLAELVRRGHDTSVVVVARLRSTAARALVRRRRCRARASVVEVPASRTSPRARTARHPGRHDDGRRPVAGARIELRVASTDSAVVMTRWATSVRWGAAFGAVVAGVLVVFVASSAASADGRRGTVIFGIAGVVFLIAGLVVSSGVYPARSSPSPCRSRSHSRATTSRPPGSSARAPCSSSSIS